MEIIQRVKLQEIISSVLGTKNNANKVALFRQPSKLKMQIEVNAILGISTQREKRVVYSLPCVSLIKHASIRAKGIYI